MIHDTDAPISCIHTNVTNQIHVLEINENDSYLYKSHAIAGTTARCAVNFEAGSDCAMAQVPSSTVRRTHAGAPFGYDTVHLEI